jgi:hypothetical protein
MNCTQHFADTGFLDLLPFARELAQEGMYTDSEMIEAICMTFDKSRDYPPKMNRRKWFQIVFTEKLEETRAMAARQAYEMLRHSQISRL